MCARDLQRRRNTWLANEYKKIDSSSSLAGPRRLPTGTTSFLFYLNVSQALVRFFFFLFVISLCYYCCFNEILISKRTTEPHGSLRSTASLASPFDKENLIRRPLTGGGVWGLGSAMDQHRGPLRVRLDQCAVHERSEIDNSALRTRLSTLEGVLRLRRAHCRGRIGPPESQQRHIRKYITSGSGI